ncbi:hypothetical protein DAETH_38870 (plasmid) [Deinococcus aetherius]|uniref:Ricin B lectin domain-containing protein n=1 Tax=Deinococcus aetherius TaxID=200252 RepID=A0ABN6RKS9_9DEIO|nr:RICIN domain-containing protein [Deinococcus aetherius]BDP43918.1 hypothetical protein DAETH_38870 [Deinococcus aetherius]
MRLFWLGILGMLALIVGCGQSAGSGEEVDAAAPILRPLASGNLLRDGTALYPRLVRLASSGSANGRVLASVVQPPENGQPGKGLIYESTSGGASFSQVGTVTDSLASGGLCCSTLYELPHAVGSLNAGTLLWAASVGQDATNRRMSLRVWKSTDVGRTWTYLSACVTATTTGGLWEPEFSIASDGALVCHYSDETDGVHSQKLARVRSSDGVNWGNRSDTVASSLGSDRPGMAVVRKLPNGTYFMTYEICAASGQCTCVVHSRTSPDGWNWGSATDLGIRPETPDGKYFKHAPTTAWAPSPSGNGRLLLVGQILYNKDGSVASGNGTTLLANTENGTGLWYELPAPVGVPGAYDNYCPNYSSALLPSADGKSVLEMATDYAGGVCKASFASGSLQGTRDASGIVSGGTYRLINVNSGLCLDVPQDSRVQVQLQQWTCNGLGPQNWLVGASASGTFTLKGQNSGLCMDVDKDSRSPGGVVQQYTCNGLGPQNWRFEALGLGYYRLVGQNSGLCLDVTGGSRALEAKMQQYTCNDLAPQLWKVERR